jgi:hypothetical protein
VTQDAQTELAGALDTRAPERGLADPRLTLEQKFRRPVARVIDERREPIKILLATDERYRSSYAHLVDDATRPESAEPDVTHQNAAAGAAELPVS